MPSFKALTVYHMMTILCDIPCNTVILDTFVSTSAAAAARSRQDPRDGPGRRGLIMSIGRGRRAINVLASLYPRSILLHQHFQNRFYR